MKKVRGLLVILSITSLACFAAKTSAQPSHCEVVAAFYKAYPFNKPEIVIEYDSLCTDKPQYFSCEGYSNPMAFISSPLTKAERRFLIRRDKRYWLINVSREKNDSFYHCSYIEVGGARFHKKSKSMLFDVPAESTGQFQIPNKRN